MSELVIHQNFSGSLHSQIISLFKVKGVNFCVLRNSDTYWKNGEDIDILIPQKSLSSAVSHLRILISGIQTATIIYDKQVANHRHIFICFLDITSDCNKVLVIDFQTAIIENDHLFFTSDAVLNNVLFFDNIPRPTVAMEIVLLVIHSVFGKLKFNKNYWEFIINNYNCYSNEVEQIFRLIFCKKNVLELLKFLEIKNESGILSLNNSLYLHSIKKQRQQSSAYKLKRKISCFVKPPGQLMSFEGDYVLSLISELNSILQASPYRCNGINNNKNFSYFNGITGKPNIIKFLSIYFRTVRPKLVRNQIVLSADILKELDCLASERNSFFSDITYRFFIKFLGIIIIYKNKKGLDKNNNFDYSSSISLDQNSDKLYVHSILGHNFEHFNKLT